MSKNKLRKVVWFSLFLLLLLMLFLFYSLPKGLHPPLSKIIRYDNGKIAHVYLAKDDQYRIYIPIKDIPLKFQKFILTKEDQYFYYHFGVNPVSLFKAFFRLLKYKKVINGGSTITMQLARITEPKKRTVINKILEILRATQFELKFSKKQILEFYLNYAPFGKNIVGVETASLFYFGRSIKELNNSEMAILANLPQIPGVDFMKNKQLLKKKRDLLLKRLLKKKIISKKEYNVAIKRNIQISFHSFPKDIPHISDYLYLYGNKNDITTTIDEGLQNYLLTKIHNHSNWLLTHGITNCSAVLMDIRTGKILAITGSLDYRNKENQGEVRGFFAPRSPGSTLKPFLYALAIEHAIITPATKLKDVPLSFRDFVPANFDNQYRGLVSAEQSLAQSLNIPFVRLLKKVGKDNFLTFLKDIGFSTLKENDYYGLSLILGACEVNLVELTNAYRIFPNMGIYSEYKLIKDKNNKTKAKRVLSKGSCYLTMRALSKNNNPFLPNGLENELFLNKIKWKTGTSKNFKDAWTIGFGNRYVLGVWVGNFKGRSSINLIGVKAAAPIFFDILGNLEKNLKDVEVQPPKDLTLIKVCPVSGKRVSVNCSNFIYTETLKNNEYTEICDMHKKFILEKKSGLRITSLFPGVRELESRVFVVFPADVKNYIKHYSQLYPDIPPIHPKCFNYTDSKRINIISPKMNMIYLLTQNGKIPLNAYSKKNHDNFYWFLDGKFYKKTNSEKNEYLTLTLGKHKLEVINDTGSYRQIIFYVY